MRLLRWLFTAPTPIKGHLELEARSLRALLHHVAILVDNDDASAAIEETIAAKGRDLLAAPDPMDTGNPFSFMAWMSANHAQMVRDQKTTAKILLIFLPIFCFAGVFSGCALFFVLFA